MAVTYGAKAFDNEGNYKNVSDQLFASLGNGLAPDTLSKPEPRARSSMVGTDRRARPDAAAQRPYIQSVRDRRINLPSRISIVPTPESFRYLAR